LKIYVPAAINTGLSGIPYGGRDIGGFVQFRSTQARLAASLALGLNSRRNGLPETPSYHPDPKDLHNPAIEPICKKYLELRYQFMPYLYSAVKETCETGLPIVRALWLHYPDDQTAVARGDQYLYGRDVLVAPVVEKGASSRSVYLPHGKWFDFWTKDVTDGGREVARTVDLETIPLYVRAGAVLPMGPIKQYTAEKVDEPMTVWVHPGSDGQFSLYEDDGHTFNFRKGDFTRIDMTWTDSRRQLSMRLAKGSKMLEPAKRRIVVKVAGQNTAREAVFEGRPVVVKI
jgi:alpha-glucosidase (family GH31 glycosyl hydrolase)